jgi:excinuclease ABC subunit C
MQYVAKNAENRATLPQKPGVYLFRDGRKRVLYIGKATNLRSRISQYFSGGDSRGARIFTMVEYAREISYIETDTVLEAVVLEAQLIKRYQPKYNVELKDDKSFSYIVVTPEEFPRFVFVRERELLENAKKYKRVYGPYASKKQAEIVLKTLRKIFPFHSIPQETEKGCLHFQIGLCPGPYSGNITKEEYRKHIRSIEYVLKGKKKDLLDLLEGEMRRFAEENQFERAKKRRDEIFALKHIQDTALLFGQNKESKTLNIGRLECYDISHISGQNPVASMVVFDQGRPKKEAYRKFSIKSVKGIHDIAMMREVLARRLRHAEWRYPETIIIDGGKGHLFMAEKLFQTLGVEGVSLLGVAKGSTRKKVDVYPSYIFPPSQELCKNKKLLEELREEAHRFAITFHKKRRGKMFLRR